MIDKIPYFMTNDEWYKTIIKDDLDFSIELTDKAPQKAIESFEKFMSQKEVITFE